VKVSILGCVVNGPGEAAEADWHRRPARQRRHLKRGEIVRHVLKARWSTPSSRDRPVGGKEQAKGTLKRECRPRAREVPLLN